MNYKKKKKLAKYCMIQNSVNWDTVREWTNNFIIFLECLNKQSIMTNPYHLQEFMSMVAFD